MREAPIVVLNEEDRKFAEALEELGYRKSESRAITYLAKIKDKDMKHGVGEATSRELEMGAGLRQPEVSTSMNNLKKQDLVEEREIKKEGKGRPLKCYSLKKSLRSIINSVEEDKIEEARDKLEQIDELREITE